MFIYKISNHTSHQQNISILKTIYNSALPTGSSTNTTGVPQT